MISLFSLRALLLCLAVSTVLAAPAGKVDLSSRGKRSPKLCKKLKRSEFGVSSLQRRADEFLGFAGITKENADRYAAGTWGPPPEKSNGYAQLGKGLYLIDSLETAKGYAGKASHTPPYGKVCMIYATNADHWKKEVPKLWFPEKNPDTKEELIGHDDSDDSDEEKTEPKRKKFATEHGMEEGKYVRFADHKGGVHQCLIPTALQTGLKAVCYEQNDPKLVAPAGFSYAAKKAEWNICVI